MNPAAPKSFRQVAGLGPGRLLRFACRHCWQRVYAPYHPAEDCECGTYNWQQCSHECVLAIVGSVGLMGIAQAIEEIAGAFERHDPSVFVSGGALGIDTMAQQEADARRVKTIICHPTFNQWEPKGYKERNEQIAQLCDHLVRIYDPKSRTYGSGWTADRAEALGKYVERIPVPTE